MLISALRISFVQFELQAGPLRAKPAPAIPFSFLLNGPDFRTQFTLPLDTGPCSPPWQANYARKFWNYYTPFPRFDTQEIWRAMVPLEYPLAWSLSSSWGGDCLAKAFLYPWGIGILVDVGIAGKMSFEDAINKAIAVRRSATLSVQAGTTTTSASVAKLLGLLFDHVRNTAFGPMLKGAGSPNGPFTVVTFVDGEGDDLQQEVQQDSNLHKGLEGLVQWDDRWTKLKPPALALNTIKTKGSAPANHLFYGNSRGRAVWFPEFFISGSNGKDTRLPLYHQNLTMAGLHTESLCLLARDVAQQFENNKTRADWSYSYDECAKRVAGILGRMYGGKNDTYRSRSVQFHIQGSFKDNVNAMRAGMEMGALQD